VSRVLYIGGCTRSGSTLVDRMLGRLPGFLSTGELGLLTTHSLRDNRLCGCGTRFLDCPFWATVGTHAFGGWRSAEASELLALHAQIVRHRHLHLLVSPGLSPRFAAKLRRYRELLAQLYDALHSVSGGATIIDSTKAPAYAYVLRGVRGVDLQILHLVRDSRGTAFSSSKTLIMKDSVDRVVYKHRYSPAVITLRWMLYHLLFDYLKLTDGGQLLLRYEDFVHDPKSSLQRIAAFAGVPVSDASLAFCDSRAVQLGVDHTVAGNDMRFSQGVITIREDDEWRRSLNRRQRRVVTALSWVFLRRWGYA